MVCLHLHTLLFSEVVINSTPLDYERELQKLTFSSLWLSIERASKAKVCDFFHTRFENLIGNPTTHIHKLTPLQMSDTHTHTRLSKSHFSPAHKQQQQQQQQRAGKKKWRIKLRRAFRHRRHSSPESEWGEKMYTEVYCVSYGWSRAFTERAFLHFFFFLLFSHSFSHALRCVWCLYMCI